MYTFNLLVSFIFPSYLTYLGTPYLKGGTKELYVIFTVLHATTPYT